MKTQVRASNARRALQRVGSATIALALGVGLTACGAGDSEPQDDASPAATTGESAAAKETSGPVTVLDQTKIRLVTAQQTFESKGLVVEVVDATGQGRTIDDPTEWVVQTQTPAEGTVEPGSTITLEVRRTDDPVP